MTTPLHKSNCKTTMLQRVVVLALSTLTAALCLHCSSDQSSSQQGDPVESNGATDAKSADASLNGNPAKDKGAGESMNNAVNGGSKNNFAGANGGTGNSPPANNAALGASLNNATKNMPNANAKPLNASATPTNNATANLAKAANVDNADDSNGSDDDTSAPNAPQSAAPGPDAAARAAASPFNNPHMNWPGKGKVKYVTHQMTRHSAPNGPVIGEFGQGEHPLVFQNGNWTELNDGSFVRGNGLSEKGVGYPQHHVDWH